MTRTEYERDRHLAVPPELRGTLEGILALGVALKCAETRQHWSLSELRDLEPSPGTSCRDKRVRAMQDFACRCCHVRLARSESRHVKPAQPLTQRCEKWIANLVRREYERCDYRTCSCGHRAAFFVGDNIETAHETKLGETYSRRCTYRKRASFHKITTRRDWRQTVLLPGLALAYLQGGQRLVLDAERLSEESDETYRVHYVRQAAGTAIMTAVGYVIRRRQDDGQWLAGCGESLCAAQRDCAHRWRQVREAEHRDNLARAEVFWAAYCAATV